MKIGKQLECEVSQLNHLLGYLVPLIPAITPKMMVIDEFQTHCYELDSP